jgi:predicted MFS family arabinose efflux permease
MGTPAMAETVNPVADVTGAGRSLAASAYWTIFLLALTTMLSVADRGILSILLVPIQDDLKVSDTAMGALTGISFTLVYATVALPMARLADKRTRRTIVAGALALWSVTTAVCGMATNYVTLLVARMGVAAGEASALPSSMSMVGDLFPAKSRGRALAFIQVGAAFGTGLGAIVVGQLAALYGWRTAFWALGVPGLLLALLILLTVREPVRGLHEGGDRPAAAGNWRETLAYLFSIRSFRALLVGHVFVGLSFYIFTSWIPTYLIRVRHMPMDQMSIWYGLHVIPAVAGILIGGVLSDRMTARRGARWRPILLSMMILCGVPIFFTLLFSPDLRIVLAMLFLYAFVVAPVSALSPATNLDVVHARARGTVTAVANFSLSVIGAGLGPLLVGALNDVVKQSYGDQAMRYTLLVLPVCMVATAVCFLIASRSTDRDAAAVAQGGNA